MIDPAKPALPQVYKQVAREVDRSKPEYIVIATSEPEISEQFVFPDIQTIMVLSSDAEAINPAAYKEMQQRLEERNIELLRGKHILKELYHSISQRYRTAFPVEVMAATIVGLPESLKHCLENAVLAVDHNKITPYSSVISIAGDNEIPDTAVLMEPSRSKNMIDSRIIKIICHPYRQEF